MQVSAECGYEKRALQVCYRYFEWAMPYTLDVSKVRHLAIAIGCTEGLASPARGYQCGRSPDVRRPRDGGSTL